jgi:hypothetical protein
MMDDWLNTTLIRLAVGLPSLLDQGIHRPSNDNGRHDSCQLPFTIDFCLIVQMMAAMVPESAGFKLGIKPFQIFPFV